MIPSFNSELLTFEEIENFSWHQIFFESDFWRRVGTYWKENILSFHDSCIQEMTQPGGKKEDGYLKDIGTHATNTFFPGQIIV